ncbi:tryptophan--tRNA ligase [Patescibacteria group bacterium]|nr:tryptophan--tRNA ligase [Patescibacteria group bacterium]
MAHSAQRLLTGIKPTGAIHVGNYFGAMRQIITLLEEYDSYVFIADYHALNQVQNAEEMQSNVLEITKAYLAVGLDPEKITLFRQSDVPVHTELTWIFNTITPMATLELAHAYKDALANGRASNVGLFDYPVLMAADILLYDAAIVPVGSDQRQHVEIAREIGRKFNNSFGETFVLPKEVIQDATGIVPGTDGRKMSKSYNNTIGLFDTEAATTKACMSIVTDSKGATEPKDPETCNVFALHKLFSTDSLADIESRYRAGTISYKESKEMLAANINAYFAPIRAKKVELDQNPEYVLQVLKDGKEKAMVRANAKMAQVRKLCGFN